MCDRYAAGAAVALTDTDSGRGEVQWQIALGIVLAQAAVPTLERDGPRERNREIVNTFFDLYGSYTWPSYVAISAGCPFDVSPDCVS